MKRILYTIFISLTLTSIAQSQPNYTASYILKLHEKLKNASGTQKADILNELGYAWNKLQDTSILKNWVDVIRLKGDSVRYYAVTAMNLSKDLAYNKGLAIGTINLVHGIRYGWWDQDGFPKPDVSKTLDSMQMLLDRIQPLLNQVEDHKFLAEYYVVRGDVIDKRDRRDFLNYFKSWQKAIAEYEQAGLIKDAAELSTWLSFAFIDRGYLTDALDYSMKGLEYARKWETPDTTNQKSIETLDWKQYLIKQSLANLATVAKNGGDYYASMNYLNELFEFQKKTINPWPVNLEKADIFISMGNVDSALFYQKQSEITNLGRFSVYTLARIYMLQEKYKEAIPLLRSTLDSFIIKRNHPDASTASGLLGKANAFTGNYNEGLLYTRFAISVAYQWGRRAYLVPAYETLSQIHHKMGQNDSAYFYLNSYIKLKDSIQNSQFLWQLHKTQKEASTSLLMKDNQLKAQQIKQQATLRNILLAGILILLIVSGFIWRNINLRKRNEQLELIRKQAQLQQQAQELEMKALKAQMNPHFIFNSLSSINWFILKNKTQEASDYLTSFSRLIRMVLNNSEKPLISLDEELKMLRLYLDMEHLRLEHSFDYKIEMMNNIDPAEIYMPPMILQPFCENAIWHGLAHKSEKGILTVNFELQGNTLTCTIADNGVGRKLAAQLNNNASHKEKSMGIQITKTRLSLFNGAQNEAEYYNIEDVKNDDGTVDGTKVTLKIKSKEVA